jgi:mannose-6-phosphate isomerase-like protein (cupin superfamily)
MSNNNIVDKIESERSHAQTSQADFYAKALEVSARFREDYDKRLNVVKWNQMPFERSPDGLIKHIIHEDMNTKECCLDIYMQFLPPGKASGKHRHLSEEIFFVVEGSGYDLHWDVEFDCKDEIEFRWAEEPKRFEWSQGDFVYIPPYCAHKHFNSDPKNEARIVVINSRIVKPMGFDWFEQLENAEGY